MPRGTVPLTPPEKEEEIFILVFLPSFWPRALKTLGVSYVIVVLGTSFAIHSKLLSTILEFMTGWGLITSGSNHMIRGLELLTPRPDV